MFETVGPAKKGGALCFAEEQKEPLKGALPETEHTVLSTQKVEAR